MLGQHSLTSMRTLILLGMMFTLTGCAVRSTIEVEGLNPPTFTVTSQPLDFFLSVSEVAVENYEATPWNNYFELNRRLWQISIITNDSVSLPQKVQGVSRSIVYGQLPPDLMQDFPSQSAPPPPLTEGRIYQVDSGSSCCENVPESMWFKIENGRAIKYKYR